MRPHPSSFVRAFVLDPLHLGPFTTYTMPADPAQAASSSGGDLPPIMDPEAVVAEAVAEERPKRMARPTLVCAAVNRSDL